MSYIPGDERYDDLYFETPEVKCELCGEPCTLHGDANYCDACQRQVDLEEIPVLQPITVRPVELNADLWKEWIVDREELEEIK